MRDMDSDWDMLASELVRQNYAFVAYFAMIVWDCLITFRQEVKYVWHCSSRTTKYLFFLCRYYALGYFIVCSIFGTQWRIHDFTSRTDCRIWICVHVGSFSVLYLAAQWVIIRKVFHLYGRSQLLAGGLFASHCIQITCSFFLTCHVSHTLNFNSICTGRNIPNIVLSILVSLACNQCITWALILRKIKPELFPSWRRYMRTSDAQAKLSCALCLVAAILLPSSHSFARQHLVPIYTFTSPLVMMSIGTCRYILRVEKDRDMRSKLSECPGAIAGNGGQLIGEGTSLSDAIPIEHQPQHLYQYPAAQTPSPLSESEALSIRTTEAKEGVYDLDSMVDSNFPYLHGAQAYKLKKNRRSMFTLTASIDSIASTRRNHSPQISSDGASRPMENIRTSVSLGQEAGVDLGSVLYIGPVREDGKIDEVDRTPSESSIEIGPLQPSSSVDSAELRHFYNNVWSAGPYVAGCS